MPQRRFVNFAASTVLLVLASIIVINSGKLNAEIRTLSGKACVAGLFFATRECYRNGLSNWDCVHAISFSSVTGALYGVGIANEWSQ